MKKLNWKFDKKAKQWDCTNYIHPTIHIRKGSDYFPDSWIMHFSGRVRVDIPFAKITTAKRVAQDIFNG